MNFVDVHTAVNQTKSRKNSSFALLHGPPARATVPATHRERLARWGAGPNCTTQAGLATGVRCRIVSNKLLAFQKFTLQILVSIHGTILVVHGLTFMLAHLRWLQTCGALALTVPAVCVIVPLLLLRLFIVIPLTAHVTAPLPLRVVLAMPIRGQTSGASGDSERGRG